MYSEIRIVELARRTAASRANNERVHALQYCTVQYVVMIQPVRPELQSRTMRQVVCELVSGQHRTLSGNKLGAGVDAALAMAGNELDHWRSTLRDGWNIHGITANDEYRVDGQPWCTAHYCM